MPYPYQERILADGIMKKSPYCADCLGSPAEWVSINLGVTLCIECSGIHRGLGVHISKVRGVAVAFREMTSSVILILSFKS